MVRQIETHHDGHGLNESLDIDCDDRDPNGGGSSHRYTVTLSRHDPYCIANPVARIQFQQGPRNVEGSTPGITEAVLYAILIDRLEGFQAGPFACAANEEQLVHLRACLALTKARADERAARGVLGRNEA